VDGKQQSSGDDQLCMKQGDGSQAQHETEEHEGGVDVNVDKDAMNL
jgi:hypothetical protein